MYLNNEANLKFQAPQVFFVPKKTEDALNLFALAELVVLLQQECCLLPVSYWSSGTRGELHLLVAVVELHVKVGTETLPMICDEDSSVTKSKKAHRKSIFLDHTQVKNRVELDLLLALHLQIELLDEGHVGDDLMGGDVADHCLLLLNSSERLEAEAIFVVPELQHSFLRIILLKRSRIKN